ncbi:MAG: hypothetical protein SGILL_004577 [Bacillariaceae sp.]
MEPSNTSLASDPIYSTFLPIPEDIYNGTKHITHRNKATFEVDDAGLYHFEKGDHIGCFNDERNPNDGKRHWYTHHVGAIAHETKMDEESGELKVLMTRLEDGLTRWIPVKHCQPHGNRYIWKYGPYLTSIYLANNVDDDDSPSEWHFGFKLLAANQTISNSPEFLEAVENLSVSDSATALFTYWQGKRLVGDLDDYMDEIPSFDETAKVQVEWTAVDPRLFEWAQENHPGVPIYHTLSRRLTAKIDDKMNLFQLYRTDEIAASAFPPTYSTISDALADSEGDDDQIFFLKDRGATQGKGIRIMSRRDLAKAPEQRRGAIKFVIQKAITDVLIIDDPPDGLLSGRRFDVRFFVLVTHGKVYLHSNMYSMFSTPSKAYDPKDLSAENHVPKVANYIANSTHRPDRDMVFCPNTFQAEPNGTPLDPVAWRSEIVKVLSKASRAVLDPLIYATRRDPFAYHYFGADAIIERSTGRAYLMEFNDWPDFSGMRGRKYPCYEENNCPRRAISVHRDGSYTISQRAKQFYHVFSGYSTQVLQDFAATVMGVESKGSEDRILEIIPWTEVDEGRDDSAGGTDEL